MPRSSEEGLADVTEVEVTVAAEGPARLEALRVLAEALTTVDGYAEVRVDHDPFPSLCALVNGAQSWLMLLRYDGDAGFSSRNLTYRGDASEMVEYYLSNGQRDLYPAAWAYPTPRTLEAVTFFAEHRRVPDWIAWFNDSGDGAASPNDPWREPA